MLKKLILPALLAPLLGGCVVAADYGPPVAYRGYAARPYYAPRPAYRPYYPRRYGYYAPRPYRHGPPGYYRRW